MLPNKPEVYISELDRHGKEWRVSALASTQPQLGVDVNKRGSPVQARHFLFFLNNGSIAPSTDTPHPFITLPASHHLLSSNPHSLQCTSRPSFLRSGPRISYLAVRSSNLNGATTASTKTFLTALVLNGIIASAEIVAFTVVWRYFRLIYEPRSLSVFESCVVHLSYNVWCSLSYRKRQQALSSHFLGWPISVFKADYRKIKNINGLDCYFYLRFLRMMVRVLLPIWLISWAVLLPLTSVNTGVPGHSGLDKFIFGNIAATEQTRYAGQVLLTWIFTSRIPNWLFCDYP